MAPAILAIAVTCYVLALSSFVVVSISKNTTVRIWYMKFCLLLIALACVYIYACMLGLVPLFGQVMSGRALAAFLNSEFVQRYPLIFISVGYFLKFLLQGSTTAFQITLLLVEYGVVTPLHITYFLFGSFFGRSAIPILLAIITFRKDPNFPAAFAVSIVAHVFHSMTMLILLPLEAVSSYLTDFSKSLVDSGLSSSNSWKFYDPELITDPITMSIIEVDTDVFLQLFKGGFISKRPISKYLCSIGQVLDECVVYDNNTIVTEDPFYQMVQHSTTGDYFWAQNESIQTVDLVGTSNAIDYSSCFDNNSLLSSSETVQIFSFQFLNLSSMDTKHCPQLLTGIGLPKDLQLPPDWPNLEMNEVTVSVVIYIILMFASWLFLIFFALLLKSFSRGILEVQFATFLVWSRKFNGDLIGKVKKHLLNFAYFFTGFLITILTENVMVTMVLLITTATMNIQHGLSSICISILGVELGSLMGDYGEAKEHGSVNIHIRTQVATAALLYYVTGFTVFHVIPLVISGKSSVLVVAKYLSQAAYSYSWWPITYFVISFVIIPVILLLLSVAGWQAFIAILVAILCVVIVVVIINMFQTHHPTLLPHFLRNWAFLPAFLSSLKPYDELFLKVRNCVSEKKTCVCPCGVQKTGTATVSRTPTKGELQGRVRSSLSIANADIPSKAELQGRVRSSLSTTDADIPSIAELKGRVRSSLSIANADIPQIAELQGRVRSSLSIADADLLRSASYRSLKSKSGHALAKQFRNLASRSKESD